MPLEQLFWKKELKVELILLHKTFQRTQYYALFITLACKQTTFITTEMDFKRGINIRKYIMPQVEKKLEVLKSKQF